jgi:hypothetical protein
MRDRGIRQRPKLKAGLQDRELRLTARFLEAEIDSGDMMFLTDGVEGGFNVSFGYRVCEPNRYPRRLALVTLGGCRTKNHCADGLE